MSSLECKESFGDTIVSFLFLWDCETAQSLATHSWGILVYIPWLTVCPCKPLAFILPSWSFSVLPLLYRVLIHPLPKHSAALYDALKVYSLCVERVVRKIRLKQEYSLRFRHSEPWGIMRSCLCRGSHSIFSTSISPSFYCQLHRRSFNTFYPPL